MPQRSRCLLNQLPHRKQAMRINEGSREKRMYKDIFMCKNILVGLVFLLLNILVDDIKLNL